MTKTNKLALITGAGSGIGRALAVEAEASGYSLVLAGRRRDALEQTAQSLGHANIRIVSADITTAVGRHRIVDAVGDRLDILVNNAGSVCVGRLTDLDDDEVADMIGTNLTAPTLLTRDLIPAIAATQGRIVNVGSMFGMIAFPYFSTYSATKFAMRGLSDALRRELAEYGISVTFVAPRATRTPAQSQFAHLVEPFEMVLDDPATVARKTWAGVMAGRSTIYPGMAERGFTLVQALFPSLIDGALTRKALAPRAQAALNTFHAQKEA